MSVILGHRNRKHLRPLQDVKIGDSNGAQTPFPLEEYYKMKATDKYIRKIRFVRIDDCLYEAPTDCFKAFHADAECKRREQARRKKAGKDGYRLIHYEALSSEGISGEERIEDPNCDVEETALLHLQICELRKALSKLSPEAYELIQAIHFKNICPNAPGVG